MTNSQIESNSIYNIIIKTNVNNSKSAIFKSLKFVAVK